MSFLIDKPFLTSDNSDYRDDQGYIKFHIRAQMCRKEIKISMPVKEGIQNENLKKIPEVSRKFGLWKKRVKRKSDHPKHGVRKLLGEDRDM